MRFRAITGRFQPIRAIEWVVVVVSMLHIAYVYPPFSQIALALPGLSPFLSYFVQPVVVYAYIGAIVATGLLLGYGLLKNSTRIQAMGLFGQILVRFYGVLITIIILGPALANWIYPFTLVVICVILWWSARMDVRARGSA